MASNLKVIFYASILLFNGVVYCTADTREEVYISNDMLPVIVNTWPFVDANKKAVQTLLSDGGSLLDAVEYGCTQCEIEQCDGSVGYGGSPDENGETTLDAMIMDGDTHDVGSVGCLRNVKSAISVARAVLEHTSHTLLAGELATQFAKEMGFTVENLTTNHSQKMWSDWKANNCQPNYWKSVTPDPTQHCGPYHNNSVNTFDSNHDIVNMKSRASLHNHDTIGMIIVDKDGHLACGTTTNGMNHKIPGRVGDSPIAGAGCYVEKGVGGAAATGDGDVMMRFLPSYRVVMSMSRGLSPTDAVNEALTHIASYYPTFNGALIAVNINGEYGGGSHGFSPFPMTVFNPKLGNSTVIKT